MKDLVYLLGAAAVGAVAWQMYSNNKARKNPDPDEDMAAKMEQRLAALSSQSLTSSNQVACAPVDKVALIEQRLDRLERLRKNPPRRPRYEEDDDDDFYGDE